MPSTPNTPRNDNNNSGAAASSATQVVELNQPQTVGTPEVTDANKESNTAADDKKTTPVEQPIDVAKKEYTEAFNNFNVAEDDTSANAKALRFVLEKADELFKHDDVTSINKATGILKALKAIPAADIIKETSEQLKNRKGDFYQAVHAERGLVGIILDYLIWIVSFGYSSHRTATESKFMGNELFFPEAKAEEGAENARPEENKGAAETLLNDENKENKENKTEEDNQPAAVPAAGQ